jgi:hypothetical protein
LKGLHQNLDSKMIALPMYRAELYKLKEHFLAWRTWCDMMLPNSIVFISSHPTTTLPHLGVVKRFLSRSSGQPASDYPRYLARNFLDALLRVQSPCSGSQLTKGGLGTCTSVA